MYRILARKDCEMNEYEAGLSTLAAKFSVVDPDPVASASFCPVAGSRSVLTSSK